MTGIHFLRSLRYITGVEIEVRRLPSVPTMTLPDPDQDLLNKLDRREHRLEVLSLAPTFGWALAASLATFGVLSFGINWSREGALEAAGLVFILAAFLLYLRTRRKNRD